MLNFFIKGFRVSALLTIVSRVSGFVRDIFLAYFLGAGIQSDIFLISSKLPNLFRRITAEGAMTSSFLPIYSQLLHMQKNDKDNAQKFSAIICFILLFLLFIIVTIFEIFMPEIISVIAPGIIKNSMIFDQVVIISRFTIIFLPFISLTALFGAMLNASGRFFYFAFTPIIFNLIIILACFFITENFKIKSLPLAIAMPIAGFVQLCFIFYFAKKFKLINKAFFKLSNFTKNSFLNFKTYISKAFKRFLPAVFTGGIFQINILVDTILATLVGFGAVSFLYYADRIIQLPLGIIGVSLGTALVSSVSHPKVINNDNRISDQLIRAIKISIYFSVPSMLSLIFFSEFIISGLFERGSFQIESVKSVALALSMYSLGLPFIMIIKCLQSVFIALGQLKKILFISIIQLSLNIVLSIILMKYLAHAGIALATTISNFFAFIIYIIYTIKKKKLKMKTLDKNKLDGLDNIVLYILKILFISFIMIFILYQFLYQTNFSSGFIYLSLFTILGVLFYIIITYITKTIPTELFSKKNL